MERFSSNEILRGYALEQELPIELQLNLATLKIRLTSLFAGLKKPLIVSSGYRPPAMNSTVAGAAPQSWHTKCAAADIHDPTGEVWAYCMKNLSLCADLGIWLEDKRWTPNWVHLQIYPPKSGKRIYIPSSKPALNSKLWDGKYDSKYDSKTNT